MNDPVSQEAKYITASEYSLVKKVVCHFCNICLIVVACGPFDLNTYEVMRGTL